MFKRVTEEIERYYQQMSQALSTENWQVLQTLDEDFQRSMANRLPLDQLNEQDKAKLSSSVQQLMKLYDQMIYQCGQHRSDIQQELTSLHHGRKGVKAYRSVL